MKVLAGDLGGTKTLLLLGECTAHGCRTLCMERYRSNAYDGLVPMVQDFLATAGSDAADPQGACFGIAGPVAEYPNGQRARVTNLPWELDSAQIAQQLGLAHVRLINDFQAIGYGIEVLAASDLVALQEGHPVHAGPRALIGAGTGLGEAMMVWRDNHYEVLPSEGGHADFAPTDGEQVALLESLRQRYGRVSYERVLSGPGLANVFAHLPRAPGERPSADLDAALDGGDPSAAISEFALSGRDPLAQRALECFVRIYGAQAGNLALTCLATGGVFLAGGIAPKILRRLQDGAFLEAFRDKGRMSEVLAKIPVWVIRNPEVGLMGAALAAARLPAPTQAAPAGPRSVR